MGLETGLIAVSAVLLVGYHIYLAYRVQTAPTKTVISLTNHTRHSWVAMVIQERRDILAIQTLRNWIMAASFLASTAILVSLGWLNLAVAPEKFTSILSTLDSITTATSVAWEVKILALVVNFFATFFNFSLAIRYFNHVTFLINIPIETDSVVTPASVARTLNRGALHYTFGMRGYYLAIPLTLWLFGPVWMLIGSLVLITVLFWLDRPVSRD